MCFINPLQIDQGALGPRLALETIDAGAGRQSVYNLRFPVIIFTVMGWFLQDGEKQKVRPLWNSPCLQAGNEQKMDEYQLVCFYLSQDAQDSLTVESTGSW